MMMRECLTVQTETMLLVVIDMSTPQDKVIVCAKAA